MIDAPQTGFEDPHSDPDAERPGIASEEVQLAAGHDAENSCDGTLDDVDDRAAVLLARIEARRSQRSTPEPAPGPEPAHTAADVEQALPTEPDQPDVAATAVLEDHDQGAPAPDAGGIDHRPRRMALPPWQTPAGGTLDEGFDPPRPSAESLPTPESLETVPPPAGRQPSPPPGWQRPPRWVPAPGRPRPPSMVPPPGWQGPPPNGLVPPRDPRARTDTRRVPGPAKPLPPRQPPSLDDAENVLRDPDAPRSGWRRAVHKATGGQVNPGMSRRERRQEELLHQIRRPIVGGDFRIAVLSIKGGVGKTTTTMGLGSALATVRADRIIAIDANPDRGTLAERVLDASTSSTVRDLLRDANLTRYADVRNHTRTAPSRLEILASEQDPAVAEVFGEADYRHTMDILRRYYNVILTDCGTGIMHSAMAGVLDLAQAIVLVSSPAIDAARSASATLDWLTQHGHADLVREAHVVLSASQPVSATLNVDKVVEHFEARCGTLHMIPFDPHLAEGADVDFRRMRPATSQAYLELAGAVSEKFVRSV